MGSSKAMINRRLMPVPLAPMEECIRGNHQLSEETMFNINTLNTESYNGGEQGDECVNMFPHSEFDVRMSYSNVCDYEYSEEVDIIVNNRSERRSGHTKEFCDFYCNIDCNV